MTKTLMGLIAGVALLINAAAANALMLSFDPGAQRFAPGDMFGVDLRASGLGSGLAPSIGAFDIIVGFDDAVLDYVGATFGTQLDINGFGSFQGAFEDPDPAVGEIFLFELSFDDPIDLDAMQSDSFVLATLDFSATGLGTSPLVIVDSVISDSNGEDLPVQSAAAGSVSVPVPATLALLSLGLIAMGRKKLR